MVKMELLPNFKPENNNEETVRQVFKFKVPISGDYQILTIPKSALEDIRVNGEKITSINALKIKDGNYEISTKISNSDNKGDLALKMQGEKQSTPSGEILNFKKENATKLSGKIRIDKPLFVFLQQTYNPSWVLTLNQGEKPIEVKEHFIGNLYSNAYFVDKIGEYNFTLEFEPQKYVNYGMIISLISGTGILLFLLFRELRRNK